MPVAAQSTPPDTRERILAATWTLVEESQDLKVRIADIAAAAGVSRQAVYLHFGNRANLLLAAVQYRDMTSPTAGIARAAETDPIPGALATFVETWFAHIPRIQPVARLLSAASQTDPEARVAWDDRMALLRRLSFALAKRLADGGVLKPEWTPGQAADWIWHRTHLDGWRHLVGECGWDAADYRRCVCTSLERDLLKTK
ncbi:MAG: TetR family transcriptional regulator [Rhizobiales bacterium]|nr:TetR family transcriptional regulator [Hyphomicrobiales bacterium]